VDILTLDFETYYDSEYSLDNLTTEDYVVSPLFEEIMLGVKPDNSPGFPLVPDRADYFLRNEVDWERTAVISQHAHFEALILSHHHGVKPALWIDTLSMARALDGPKLKNRLAFLAPRHGLGYKGHEAVKAKGKHYADFTRDEYIQYGNYCVNDCDLEYKLAQIFLPQMPLEELKVIDLLIRAFSEPVFLGDAERLKNAVAAEKQRKIDLLRRINLLCPHCAGTGVNPTRTLDGLTAPCKKCDGQGTDKKTIGSNEKLVALFRALNVEPETKRSPTTGEQIWAFAKTDSGMQSLLDHEDEQVRFLAEARIGIKSNIIETRAERFQHSAERGPMPVYIAPFAAHTFRAGGGDKRNWLNISSKHNENRPELSVIAGSIMAPPGHKIITADSGQGEPRITAWLAGQHDLVAAFAQGRDIYSEHASTVYGRPVDRKRKEVVDGKVVFPDYIPGQVGKFSILGMGFGMGWYKASMELLKGYLGAPPIQFTVADLETLQVDANRFLNTPKKTEAVSQMPSRLGLNDRLIHCIVTEALVQRYRKRVEMIPKYWNLMEDVINAMIRGEEMVFGAHGVMRTGKDCIWMPNGLKLRYDGISRDADANATYFNGRTRTKIHGPLLTENTVQCIHYIIVSRQLLEIAEVLKVGLTTYDDVVAVVPQEAANEALAFMVQALGKTPAWAAGLPLIGEGKIGDTLKGSS
jgi:DNA polymerase